MNVEAHPTNREWMTGQMSPMSWNMGSQLTDRSPSDVVASYGGRASAPPMMRWLCRRFSWLTITPFGLLVEPDVYWRKATDSEVIAGKRHSTSRSSGIPSVDTQLSFASSGALVNISGAIAATDAVVSTMPAPQSEMIAFR